MTAAVGEPATSGPARPFLKWAGGKTQLLAQLRAAYPLALAHGGIDRYIEPFLGGGAVFLDVMQRFPRLEAHLFDINPELIVAYTAVQRDAEALIARLVAERNRYLALDQTGRREHYYAVRLQYNAQRAGFAFTTYSPAWVERAAQMIFLNKLCYNGLFRVNAAGGFNVPFGRYRNPEVFDAANLRAVAALLRRTTLHIGSFEACAPFVNERTFVYLDPPYRPISRTANFNSYAPDRFGDDEQRRLAGFFARLDKTGARLMLSNSDPKNVDANDAFFDVLYAPFVVRRVVASRNINSAPASRGKITELLVTNYEWPQPE